MCCWELASVKAAWHPSIRSHFWWIHKDEVRSVSDHLSLWSMCWVPFSAVSWMTGGASELWKHAPFIPTCNNYRKKINEAANLPMCVLLVVGVEILEPLSSVQASFQFCWYLVVFVRLLLRDSILVFDLKSSFLLSSRNYTTATGCVAQR